MGGFEIYQISQNLYKFFFTWDFPDCDDGDDDTNDYHTDDDDDESQVEAGKVALLECRVTHLSPHHTVSWLRLFSSVSELLILSLTELQQERRCLRADCGRSRLQLGPPFARCHQVQVGSLSTNDHHQFSKKCWNSQEKRTQEV